MQITELAKQHHTWVETKGWHNKSTLECLALITSEVGEAVNECRGSKPTDNFKLELADIILRVLDLAVVEGINIEEVILAKMELNLSKDTSGKLK